MIDRRKFIQAGIAAGLVTHAPFRHFMKSAYGEVLYGGLSDPTSQPKFAYPVPDAMAPGFKYVPDKMGRFRVQIREGLQYTGLMKDGAQVPTAVWGYADQNNQDQAGIWPGKTFEVKSSLDGYGNDPETEVIWANALKNTTQHLVPVDTNLHWCYSLPGYEGRTIPTDGVPIITHLHGGHSDFQFDGNPEFFYGPDGLVYGPQWQNVPNGFTEKFRYNNNVPAGNLWYHDHALGITRLNVYAGLAGFYFIRDSLDTGLPGNPLGLPAWPYEKAYAIQDRMFRDTGELFYPAFPNEPFYNDFIYGEGADLPEDLFPGGGPSALAEFFGDHMLVNGVIWPREDVEPRNYRLHLLNGTDSRFMVIRFRVAASSDSTSLNGASKKPLKFHVVGSDQGLARGGARETDVLVFEPGSRYDIVIDFKRLRGKRIIMENIGGDAPFGGAYGDDLDPDADLFPDRQTDLVMAFDVADIPNISDGFDPKAIDVYQGNNNDVDNVRQVALYEGTDEFGRLQPLLGTAQESIPWHLPPTETPTVGTTEIWEIYNTTGDAHPIHLHLVNFEILDRAWFTADLTEMPTLQHNGTYGSGFAMSNIQVGAAVDAGTMIDAGYIENAPKDMVTALPEQVTRIKATFTKPGRYVWHCHILSHEDHEMMRVLQVQPKP